MLVLERKVEEEIVVGDLVRFRILGVARSGKVKVGVIAPGMQIWRGELAAGPRTEKPGKTRRRKDHGE